MWRRQRERRLIGAGKIPRSSSKLLPHDDRRSRARRLKLHGLSNGRWHLIASDRLEAKLRKEPLRSSCQEKDGVRALGGSELQRGIGQPMSEPFTLLTRFDGDGPQ
jgi:hypothetical protein